MRRNYKSDFHFIMKLYAQVRKEDGTIEKREVFWPEHDWTARLYTSIGLNAYIVSRKGDVLTNCFNDNGRIHVVCNNHRLGKGRLQCEFHAEIPNGLYPDGIEDLYEPQLLDIELVAGQGDCATQAEVNLILPYIKGDEGAAFTYSDFTSEQKAELIAPIKESIDKAITDKQDKLRVTEDFDLSENLLSFTEAGKTALFDSMWASIGGTKLDNGRYRMGATGKELTIEEAMVRYERNGFIDRWNKRCIYPINYTYGVCGRYNEASGYFELNGINDITYEEALEIDGLYIAQTETNNMDEWFFLRTLTCRTLFPLFCVGWHLLSANEVFRGCRTLKIIRFIHGGGDRGNVQLSAAYAAFDGCTALETIDARIIFSTKTADVSNMFRGCRNLKDVTIVPRSAISFSGSPLLSEASMEYMVYNGDSGITITLHPDAYARITDELFTLAAERQITLATT